MALPVSVPTSYAFSNLSSSSQTFMPRFASVSLKWRVKCVTPNPKPVRRVANYPPSIWGNQFASMPFNHADLASAHMKTQEQKEKVRRLLMSCTNDPLETINLIGLLNRFGVSYHFEREIEEMLDQIYYNQYDLLDGCEADLHATSLLFLVFRQCGYKISCDVFEKFKDKDGNFKRSLISDEKALLSLYEASHLGMHGETILDEALDFTKTHLANIISPSQEIIDALSQPLHTDLTRLQARRFINSYKLREDRDDTLLEFAILDFNRLQLVHKQELSHLSKWWKDLNLVQELSYARDRIAEIYFLILGVQFEPQYSWARIMMTKFIKLIAVIDDTYDAYATMDEVQSFTNAIERWEGDAVDQLPDYMKKLYSAWLITSSEFENEVAKQGRSYVVPYANDALKELVRSYHIPVQWFYRGYEPSFEEHMENAYVSIGVVALEMLAFIGMTDQAGIKELEWVKSKPKILKASSVIIRLMDDLVTHEIEQKRGHADSAIELYMKHYGATKQEAIQGIKEMIYDAWKDMNEECIKSTKVPFKLLVAVVNAARLGVTFKDEDSYTHPEYFKDFVTDLLVDPIPSS